MESIDCRKFCSIGLILGFIMPNNVKGLLTAIGLIIWPGLAFAGVDSGDTAWILTATALVLFMTLPGLALFYAGLVQPKNIVSVLMHNFTIACLMSVLWVVAGYSLAFSGDGAYIGDLGNLFMSAITIDSLSGTIPESLFGAFQMTFAVITPALIIGAYVERIRFSAVLIFSALWLLVDYAPVTHWVWGGGIMADWGVLDFAGGIVVHATAGTAALVCALVVGKRRGFPASVQPPHSPVLTMVGACMLWVGWFGFNGGSALGANGDAGMAILVTHLSAACGAATWAGIEWAKYGKPSVLGIITGMVAGLGTITPASGFVGPAGAVVIGISAGAVCFYATMYIKQTLKIDDSLDVMPVHGVGGILGTLAVAVFASSELGLFSGQGLDNTIGAQLAIQAQGILAAVAYTAVVTYIIFKVISVLTGGIRVNEDEESQGLDIVSHNERGYDI